MPKNKETILIVDDIPENLRILGEFLKSDYHVKVATSGKKALQALNTNLLPDIILLDIIMPEIDGYELCRQIKLNHNTKNIPIIFITAKSETLDEVIGFEVGAVDYITKPFSPSIVKARITTHLELKKYRDWLENFSYTDALTGLANRRKMDEYFDYVWNQGLRDSHPVSIIMIDIDNFKDFNDLFGHQKGDFCIQQIASSFSNTIKRNVDLVCRYGGEEFLCILPNTKLDEALKLAEALKESVLALEIEAANTNLSPLVTISLGISSMIPKHDFRPQELIVEADRSLYRSKKEGKNRISSTTINT